MKLFVSWSKETSHNVALALREWLPLVVPSAEPWVSSEDIAKGTRGRDAIVRELAGTGQGVICLTKENVREPWLNFEAGALSNHPETPRVRTVLFDLKVSDVVGPLSDFQHTDLNDKEDVWKLVHSINEESDAKLPESRLRIYFDSFWDRLSIGLQRIRESQPSMPPPQVQADDSDSAPARTGEQIMEEILERIRTVERRQRFFDVRMRDSNIVLEGIAESIGAVARSGPRTFGGDDVQRRSNSYVAHVDYGVGEMLGRNPGVILARFEDKMVELPNEDEGKRFKLSNNPDFAHRRLREMRRDLGNRDQHTHGAENPDESGAED